MQVFGLLQRFIFFRDFDRRDGDPVLGVLSAVVQLEFHQVQELSSQDIVWVDLGQRHRGAACLQRFPLVAPDLARFHLGQVGFPCPDGHPCHRFFAPHLARLAQMRSNGGPKMSAHFFSRWCAAQESF